ncbi:Kell blood group glycoprotein [Merluccius polli]|uniref:Kell blood group glycoprotein n=1 Tax=Merluccius polli TaxID=89951 RepID=A0AA47MW95_MERPO|nr:Kell blood group glycoprotein [Merluccius polli]
MPLPQSSFAQQPPPNHPQCPPLDQLLQGLPQHGLQRNSPSEPGSSSQSRHQSPIQSPKWTNHRRLLLLVLLGSSLCAIVLVLVYYSQQHVPTPTEKVTQCLSQACQRASVRLASSVDPFTHPCDYFLFTCGADIPPLATRDRYLSGEKLLDRKTALMQYLQEALESNSSSGSAVQKAKDFYHSCLDTKSIETVGVEPFLTLVQQVRWLKGHGDDSLHCTCCICMYSHVYTMTCSQLGGWGVSGQWNDMDFNSTLSVLIKQYASFPFFNLYVGRDPNEVARGTDRKYIQASIPQINEPDLLIPTVWNKMTQKSIAKTQTLMPFLALCQEYLDLLGATASQKVHHVGVFISLSSELAVATSPLSYRQLNGQLYQRITVQELKNQAPVIDWLGCLQAVFHPHPVRPEDHVLLHNLPYIVKMSNVIQNWLKKHELRSSGPLQTFMFLNLLHTFTPALDSRFRETERRFYEALGITEPEVPRWKHCIMETEKGFDTVLTHILTDMATHREAEEMLENIFSIFKTKFNHLHWGDDNSRLMKKVHTLTPRLWTNTERPREAELDLLFSKVAISTHSYFSNYIQLLSLQRQRRNRLFNQTKVVDMAMNYGVLGIFIAKDIFHLLLQDNYSLSEAVRATVECVWAHYLVATGKSGGGNATALSAAQQREIWLQYSALHVAFQAYQQSLQRQPEDSSLLHFSSTHLFLTSFAQVSCDPEPHGEVMPLEPSFLVTVLCSTSRLCPATLDCASNTQLHALNECLPHSS